MRLSTALAATATFAGCSVAGRPSCTPGVASPAAIFTLYLGKAIPGRKDLTDREWQAFLNSTVTANLPNGYAVFDAHGGWMNPITHRTIQEETKVLKVALPDTPGSQQAINRIRVEYQSRFHQQLVGMTIQYACATF